MTQSVAIIILNWNGWQDTIECLESVYQIFYSNYTVILVDNGSEDGSLEQIRDYCAGKLEVRSKFFEYNYKNKPIKIIEYTQEEANAGVKNEDKINNLQSNRELILIRNDQNYGFAKGNNIGIRFALRLLNPNFILLLNNDTVVTKNFLIELIKRTQVDGPHVGIWSPKLLNYFNPKILDSTGHHIRLGHIQDRGEMQKDRGQYDQKLDILGAIAAAALYKTKMIHEIGCFNETFVTLYEDAELSWRAYKKGWKARYVPSSTVYHKHGSTINKHRSLKPIIEQLYIKNIIWTVKTYGTISQKWIFSLIFLKLGVISMIKRSIWGENIGILPYLKELKNLFK